MISKFTPLSSGNKFSLTKLKKDSNKPKNFDKILLEMIMGFLREIYICEAWSSSSLQLENIETNSTAGDIF